MPSSMEFSEAWNDAQSSYSLHVPACLIHFGYLIFSTSLSAQQTHTYGHLYIRILVASNDTPPKPIHL